MAGRIDHPDWSEPVKPSGLTGVAVVMVPVVAAGLLLWVLFFGAQPAAASCAAAAAAGPIPVGSIPSTASVDGFGHDQLVNAALILNAGTALKAGAAGQLLGVQAAIGESSLVDLDRGDGAINPDGSVADSLGLFQQQSSWGTVAQRLDPTTAASVFFRRLLAVVGWQQLPPTLAINTVQGNADPDYYAAFRRPAVEVVDFLATLAVDPSATATPSSTPSLAIGSAAATASAGSCAGLSGDARQLAGELILQIKAGRLTILQAQYQREIADVAAGTASVNCGLDPRTLQIIALALQTWRTVGVSDLNRRCTGSLLGAGTESAHWINGGGQAVDFYAFDGQALTGGDPDSMRFLHVLDPIVPTGTRAGQAECRTAAVFVHLVQFDDTCDHLHVDVAYTGGAPLELPASTDTG